MDYSKSVRQVYIDAANYIIESTEKLDIICSMVRGDDEFKLPSWVPAWTVRNVRFGSPLSNLLDSEGDPFSSSGSTLAEAELKHEDDVLIAKGFVLSRIQLAGQDGTFDALDDFRAGIPFLLNSWRLLLSKEPPMELDAFARILFSDRFSAVDFEGYETEEDLMHKILGAIALLSEDCPQEEVDPRWKAFREEFNLKEWWARSWIKPGCSNLICRRFFVSDSGLRGQCPAIAEPGDLICILHGCFVPVVLRPCDGHYTFLGEAYVHGYMYGRGMKEFEEGKFQLETFEIR